MGKYEKIRKNRGKIRKNRKKIRKNTRKIGINRSHQQTLHKKYANHRKNRKELGNK